MFRDRSAVVLLFLRRTITDFETDYGFAWSAEDFAVALQHDWAAAARQEIAGRPTRISPRTGMEEWTR
jgi:hypothetical protein